MILAALFLGIALGVLSGERTIRVLRTELNTRAVNEQLLLTRLASRTPAEFHAVTAQVTSRAPDTTRHLFDDTGLVQVDVDGEED